MQLITCIYLGSWLLCACSSPNRSTGLKPFTSDGCSLFPDKDYWEGGSWCQCCVKHDYQYWKGGPLSSRKQADLELKDCVLQATGDEALVNTMYLGIRSGGKSLWPSSFRWGYGWPYGTGNKPITDKQERQIRKMQPVHLDSLTASICKP